MKKTIDEQVMNLGSNMIMGSLPNTDQQEQVQNLQETVEDNQAAVNAALGSGISLNDLMRRRKTRPMVKNNHIGRNEKCPCGSGKKYKHCCLNEGTYEGYHTV
jgi:uncharacterized protein YecA (UPF0149 family)